MAQISSLETVYLYTTVSGGLQPYDQCARWAGGWTANNGTTGILQVGPPGPGLPYIDSTNTPCLSPGTSGGSLTGTLIPNGFTGTISVWVDVADSSGIFKESNTKSYTVEPAGALVVNAGPNQSINGNPPTIFLNAASVTGGSNSYTYSWNQSFSNPTVTYFNNALTLNPSPVTGASSNGAYTYTLTATDTVTGLTGSDSVVINVSGNTPPPSYGSFSVSNQSGGLIAGTWTIFINSVPYNDFSTGYASIPNNTFVNLPMNNNFNPPRTGTFKIVFTPGSGMTTSRQARLTAGSIAGPVNFVLNAGKYEATINVTTPNAQLGYAIQIT
jgi:hypothetical protein